MIEEIEDKLEMTELEQAYYNQGWSDCERSFPYLMKSGFFGIGFGSVFLFLIIVAIKHFK